MAVTGLEWVIIAIIIIVLLIWGPSQLPKIARSLGQAKKEFQKAMKETEEATKEVSEPFKESIETFSREVREIDSELIKLAKMLNIETEGKTASQIAEEIAKKMKK
ncbi:MAG: twin-arginine translocase TatA/TatE family subunit [Nitrososphaerota archaeon]|nr:twin-arginine translocase TatA/TatE family subunit [Candidatus Geocrenenecus dongiae]